MTPLKAIAFDFDGVILESAAIKTDAMIALFADHPGHVDEIAALHTAHAGISRYVKFDMIHRDILNAPLSAKKKEALGRKFSELVIEKVLACPFVVGAREFLESHHASTPFFVVSGTPDEELSMIVRERGLSPYFKAVYGSARGKPDLLRQIIADQACRTEDFVFIGDGLSDFKAAMDVSVPFILEPPVYLTEVSLLLFLGPEAPCRRRSELRVRQSDEVASVVGREIQSIIMICREHDST